jgi:hypothetical protein
VLKDHLEGYIGAAANAKDRAAANAKDRAARSPPRAGSGSLPCIDPMSCD